MSENILKFGSPGITNCKRAKLHEQAIVILSDWQLAPILSELCRRRVSIIDEHLKLLGRHRRQRLSCICWPIAQFSSAKSFVKQPKPATVVSQDLYCSAGAISEYE